MIKTKESRLVELNEEYDQTPDPHTMVSVAAKIVIIAEDIKRYKNLRELLVDSAN